MKNFTANKVFLLSFYLCLFLSLPNPVCAAAWGQEKGKSQVISTLTYFSSDNYFDNRGIERSQPKFTKFSTDALYEYGFNADLTFGFQPRFDVASQKLTIAGEVKNSGVSSIDFFLRFQLMDESEKFLDGDNWVISIQPKIVAPGFDSKNNALPITTEQWDAELRMLSGYSFRAFNNEYHYVNVEAGYRKRFERPSDEFFFDATLGFRYTEDWQLLGQVFYTKSLDVGKSGLSLVSNRDYSLTKAQVSVIKRLSDKYSVQVGAFSHLRGKNTGTGEGMLLSIWADF